jgi:hypothetical protein
MGKGSSQRNTNRPAIKNKTKNFIASLRISVVAIRLSNLILNLRRSSKIHPLTHDWANGRAPLDQNMATQNPMFICFFHLALMSGYIPNATETILARRQRHSRMASAASGRPNPHVWIHTSPRRASMARMSMQLRTLPAFLIYHSENGTSQRFDLTKPVYTIGRKEDRDVVLQCPQISKHHASIERTELG